MAFQILLNVFLAFIWMFLSTSSQPSSFVAGYLLGLLILYSFRRFFRSSFYLIRVVAVIKLIFTFFKALILSNIAVLKVILKPKLDIQPGIFALETELKTDWEITLLSNLITLTPGTLVIEVSEDNSTLYIHAMHLEDMKAEVAGIKNTLEKAIMEVSR
ncbi:Na+/H+ antiporter subunit E [Bacillus testis]|uniref:Na+/H+ antiporter subunit E n=1 Tax=Bacillus testis TaxID=1622072 RepID=UPI00067F0755|nr:Na+/H+ antiporter subunit E [Bacillus testis]